MSISISHRQLFSKLHTDVSRFVVAFQKRNYNFYGQDDHTFEKATNLATHPRGTGGRCSFNGYTATVFGNTGMLGRTLVCRLGKIGTQMVLPYRTFDDWIQNHRVAGDLGQIYFHQIDIRNKENVEHSITHSNVVINLIGTDRPCRAFDLEYVNVRIPQNLARLARRNGVKRFIHVSALNCCENPKPHYLRKGSEFYRTKWLGEQAVLEEFPEATIIRPSDMFGDEDDFMTYYVHLTRRSTMNSIYLYKKGNETIKQPVYKGDVCAGIIEAMKDPSTCGKIIQAVGPHRYVLGELVTYFFRYVKRREFHRRLELTTSLMFYLKICAAQYYFPHVPVTRLRWERIERECHTDIVYDDMLRLEDLGVYPDTLEQHAVYVLYPYIFGSSLGKEHTELYDPEDPPTIVS